ncbi:MAG: class I SAM-dependent methyltransferase [Oscillospiraceae bacterium]
MDTTLHSQSVQATMLLPLWGRAKYSAENKNILDDVDARRIVESSGLDFSHVEKGFGEFSGICYIARARKIDDAVRSYISRHPKATVVNIGAGLDTSFSRVDNGQIHWYNLDLPDSIAFRRSYLPDSERNTCIAKSFLDLSWFDDVDFLPENGIIFVSGGVFYYFHEEDLQRIFSAMAERFPGGELYFDAESPIAVKGSNKMVQKTGNKGAMMYFAVKDAKALETWSPRIKLIACEAPFKGFPIAKHWSFRCRMTCRLGNLMKPMKYVHLGFL